MKKNVIVVFGGKSAEHEVSVITAEQIIHGYTKEEYNVLPVFLSKDNQFYLVDNENVSLHDFAEEKLDNKKFTKIVFEFGKNSIFKAGNKKKLCDVYACINACHGGIGENGNLVAFFEMCNIPISSGNAMGLAVGYDKVASKMLCKASGIDVLDCVWFYKEEWEQSPTKILNSLSKLKYPLIIKPARQGSSIGISVAHDAKELVSAVKLALEFDNKVLVEKALSNFKEFNCSALGLSGDVVLTSQVDEPKKLHEILSFEDKYVNGDKTGRNTKLQSGQKTAEKFVGTKTGSMASVKREFVADKKIETKIKEITGNIMRVFNLSGVIRVDFLFDTKKKKLYFNEVNTVPGSLSYYFWAREGVDINSLIERLVEIAIESTKSKFELKEEYITKLL